MNNLHPAQTPFAPASSEIHFTEEEAIATDMAMHQHKISGGHHRDNDARALRLQQQQHQGDYP